MVAKVKAKKKATPRVRAQRAGRTSTSRISSKNQITIPVEVLRSAGLVPGDEVEMTISENKIFVNKVNLLNEENPWEALAKDFGYLFKGFDWKKERAENWGE
jgi:bifunctional DNA-binding transcriptional regulator/antitoxin component of YhaV-PrlF toxin-antitoxin module